MFLSPGLLPRSGMPWRELQRIDLFVPGNKERGAGIFLEIPYYIGTAKHYDADVANVA